jgi:hypothetical protein
MNDLDERLAAWNPVRAENVLQASSSADATRLLHRILSQPSANPPRRRALQSSWRFRAWIAGAAAVAAAAAVAIVTGVASVPSTHQQPAAVSFQRGPSLGVATSAVELVDYATRSAALAPAFLPAPQDWAYFDVFYGLSRVGGPKATGEAQTWQQVGTSRYAQSWHHGKLTYGITFGPDMPLEGWPTPTGTTWYAYLASLPAQPAALRKIILANNHDNPTAAFTAIEAIFGNFPLSAQFQAELYAVLISLPGVGFTGHAVDPAGRPGIGLYLVHDGLLEAVIVNPRTYVYMGGLSIAVQGPPPYGALLAHPGKGTIVESIAILNSGFVSKLGQVP